MSATIQISEMPTFERTVKDQDGVIIPISGASVMKIIFTKPDGTVVERAAAYTTDGNDGKLYYEELMDQSGEWRWQAYVKIGAKEWYTDILSFRVYGNLKQVSP